MILGKKSWNLSKWSKFAWYHTTSCLNPRFHTWDIFIREMTRTFTKQTIHHMEYFKVHILTLNLLNFLYGIIHLPFFGTVYYHFRNIKMKIWSWSALAPPVCSILVTKSYHFGFQQDKGQVLKLHCCFTENGTEWCLNFTKFPSIKSWKS